MPNFLNCFVNRIAMKNVLLRNCGQALRQSSNPVRSLSNVPTERKADFFPRVINTEVFPSVDVLKNRRGTGGRSSFNGQIVTVFGSTGFLAKSVVNALASTGAQVIAPYRSDPYSVRHLKLAGDLGQVLFVPFELRDIDSLYRAMKHSNVVINLLGKENETGNFDFDSIHVEGARNIARVARELGVKRLIHVSALNSSPNPEPHYIKGGSNFYKSKYYGEQVVREEFPEATIFRPADIYGEQDHYLWSYCKFHRRSIRRISLPYGGYGITKTPVFVSDVAKGIAYSVTDMTAIGETYDAVGPRRYEVRQLVLYINDIIGKTRDKYFRVTNLRWDFSMKARITFTSNFKSIFKYPTVHWEKIERDCISDEKPTNPTLEDLGVHLQYIEDHWPTLLVPWRYDYSYIGDYGERKIFANPEFIVE